jgi:hypothetical protein
MGLVSMTAACCLANHLYVLNACPANTRSDEDNVDEVGTVQGRVGGDTPGCTKTTERVGQHVQIGTSMVDLP